MGDRAALPSPAITPGQPHAHTRSFPGTRQHVGQARKFIAAVLPGCPHLDDVVLLISELAANACAHSASGSRGGTFTVRAEVHPGTCVHAEVEDQGTLRDGGLADLLTEARSPQPWWSKTSNVPPAISTIR